MISRREFVRLFGSAAMMAPWATNLLAGSAPTALPVRPIPGTDDTLPIIGFGSSPAFRSGDVELSRQLVKILLDHRGSYIDAGGDSYLLLAKLMREQDLHGRLFLSSYSSSIQWDAMRSEANVLIEAQGNSAPIDLLLSGKLAEYGAHADNFRRMKEEGLARYVGVAASRDSYHQKMMDLMEAGVVDFIQVNYSILEPEAEERLLPMARDKGVAILINRPFLNGEYFKRVKGQELPAWTQEFDCHSWAQFSLKFIVSNPAVTCVLTETAKPHHAVDNMGGGMGRLPDPETRERMRKLLKQIA